MPVGAGEHETGAILALFIELRQQAAVRLGGTAMAGFMLNKPVDVCQAWEQADQALLDRLGQLGWLNRVPACVEINGLGDESYSFSQGPGRPWIAMASDGLGDVWWPIGFGEDHGRAALARAFVLLHETGHSVANRWSDPFVDTRGLGTAATDAFNRWRLGPWASGHPNRIRAVFHECLADTWALAALLELTAHAPETVAMAREAQQWRQDNSQRSEQSWTRRGGHHSQSTFGGVHHTQGAIGYLMQRREQWRGQTPEAIALVVRQCASDALLDWIDPARMRPEGQAQGLATLQEAIGPEHFDVGQGLLWRMLCLQQSPQAWRVSDHPTLAAVGKAWEHLAGRFRLEDQDYWKQGLDHLQQPSLHRKPQHSRQLANLRQAGALAARRLVKDGASDLQQAYLEQQGHLRQGLAQVFPTAPEKRVRAHP